MLTSKYTQGRVITRPRKVLKGEMTPFHKLMYELVHKGVLPRVDSKPDPHQLAFGNLYTTVLKAFEVHVAAPRATGPTAILLNDLRAARDQNAALLTETESLITNLAESHGEAARLKDQLLQQQCSCRQCVTTLGPISHTSNSSPFLLLNPHPSVFFFF
ncbi:hypothetical protein KY284_008189 [Solanum tuberosum]|nr:hypothetical protein KY284_008189 [Solanum tuberosum]